MATDFSYDVFVSHNSKDKPRVRRLAERLKNAGLKVWFDEWILKPGDDIYLAIERGLESSRVLVLCLSRAAVGSEWVGLERSTVLFRDPSNTDRRFIPLLLEDCQLPDTLRRFKYVDYRRASDLAFEELVIACRGAADQSNASSVFATTAGKREVELTAADYYNRGLRCLSGEDYDGALDALDQAIQLDPTLAYAFYNRGLTHFFKRDDDRAIEDFNQALELGFDNALLYRNRGNAFSRKGNVKRALADYAQAIVLEPENALAYLNRGEVYENTLQKKPAVADYKTVLRLQCEPHLHQVARQRLLALGVKPD
jgi:tetratricopeptide (TPR) repeat protein